MNVVFVGSFCQMLPSAKSLDLFGFLLDPSSKRERPDACLLAYDPLEDTEMYHIT